MNLNLIIYSVRSGSLNIEKMFVFYKGFYKVTPQACYYFWNIKWIIN